MPPIDSQFSLSLELTRLVPFGGIASATGRSLLQLARELSNTGSDIVVEEDLAAIFGRNRIEERFLSTYRNVVRESSVTPISKYLDIVLHAGAGPTVLRGMTDPQHMSTIIQLSLLTWFYDLGSLAKGLWKALSQRCAKAPLEHQQLPSFDLLYGSLRACKEQTSNFNWAPLLESVAAYIMNDHKPGPFDNDEYLPVNILQGCLDFFTSVQFFPDDRFMTIKMRYRGPTFVLLSVWAHHLLGLTVEVVTVKGTSIYLGSGRPSVILSNGDADEICLFQHDASEIFRISPLDYEEDIPYACYQPAFGRGSRALAEIPLRKQLERVCTATAKCLSLLEDLEFEPDERRARLRAAILFLFPDLADQVSLEDLKVSSVRQQKTRGSQPVNSALELHLTHLIFAFSCVESLTGLTDLPITLTYLYDLEPPAHHESIRLQQWSFEIMRRLMVGPEYHSRQQDTASLFSQGGWSCHTNVHLLPDPAFAFRGLITVRRGVPTRAGHQRRLVTDVIFSRQVSEMPTDLRLEKLGCPHFVPGAKTYVTISDMSFEVGVLFKNGERGISRTLGSRIAAEARETGAYTLIGFHKLLVAAQSSSLIPACDHTGSEVGATLPPLPSKYSVQAVPLDYLEHRHAKVILATAGNKWARWWAVSSPVGSNDTAGSNTRIFVRHPGACVTCCYERLGRKDFKAAVLVL